MENDSYGDSHASGGFAGGGIMVRLPAIRLSNSVACRTAYGLKKNKKNDNNNN
ncbi:hypothetical protein A2U01_0092571 [Trifolium medium]|uniref:Uncharacterized protein n=1 Tax=Trifolium medium TaxID=97028 RepID=A0A392UE46_9FABA|nr:hypothetical protein [Trifolium medium]